MWVGDKGCTNTFKAEWGKRGLAQDSSGITPKIEQCGKALKQCSSRHFGCIRKELKLKQKLLVKAELEALTSGINFRVRQLKCEFNDLLDKETRMWFQRSWALWAIHGDRNSKYFHSHATQRFQKNKIEGIRNEARQWRSNPKIVAFMMVEFYSNLFSSSNFVQPDLALDSI